MPYIPDEIIDQVRQRADIVDIVGAFVPLRKRGEDYWACCPFHKEKTPSFKVSPQRQAFYCFGCKKSGNVFHFVAEQENTDFVGAVHWLAQRVGVSIPEPTAGPGGEGDRKNADKRRKEREEGYRLLEQAAGWYRRQLRIPAAQAARDYLESRGLDGRAVADFGIGYAPDSWEATLSWAEHQGFTRELVVRTGLAVRREEQPERCYDRFRGRLMFPIRDELGRVIGFSGRILTAETKTAKYINTPETPWFQKGRVLYGLHRARQAFKERGFALVCEGQLDVIACHRAGLTNAVSAQGTAFTEQHARLLARSTKAVTLAFDADAAGEKAAVRTIDILHQAGIEVRVITLPPGEDPDSIFRHRGPEALAELMTGGREAFPFLLDLAGRRFDLDTARGKSAAAHEVLEAVKALPDPIARAAHCQWLSRELDLPEQAVYELLHNLMRTKSFRPGGSPDHGPAPGPAPVAPPALPVFSMASGEDEVLRVLLDMALTIETAALALVRELSHDMIPETPLGQALNLVLGLTEQGEWKIAARELAADQALAAHEDIGRILAAPATGRLDPAAADATRREEVSQRLQQAIRDCVNRLEAFELDRQIAETHRQLAETTDREKARELQKRSLELVKRKKALRAGAGGAGL